MIVTDSRPQDVLRPIFLTFDGEVGGAEPFAHMISNAALVKALRARAKALKVDLVFGDQVIDHVTVGGVDCDDSAIFPDHFHQAHPPH